jgi:hypothetical protein
VNHAPQDFCARDCFHRSQAVELASATATDRSWEPLAVGVIA